MAANTLTQILSQPIKRKVPEVIIIFWIIKLLTTAMGESTSDFLVYAINPYLAVIGSGVILAIALFLQLRTKRYIAWIYWFAITMVAVFGTMAADVLHIVLGVPYLITTIFFAVALVVIFILWYQVERTLSIHSIFNRRREIFYWATVMATFALGTAAGDMTASTLGLGYFPSAMLFLALFALPAVAWKFFKANAIFSFWFAYIITRPLGASFADWFGKPYLGGLGWGDEKVSIVLGIFIVIFVGYLSISKIDIKKNNQD